MVSCSPDFGARSVIDRFQQIEPKVLLATDTYDYGGKTYDKSGVVKQLRAELGAEHVVLLSEWFEETDAELEFERVPFDHPLWVLYSSGTTGLPKAIVQSQGGILMEHLKKMHLHLNAQEGDNVFWFTTTGWMMWNFLVGVLLTPASIVLYDGNPGYPDMGRLWDLAEEAGVTIFGTGAAYIHGCMKAGVEPAAGRSLSVKAVGSTGSPLSPEGFDWVYRELGDVWLFSTSGGTDVCTAFVGGVPWMPVWEGELQGRSLGCDVHAFDESGKGVIEEVGELVITQPMPSMPVFFWGDEDGSKLREAYFEMYPGRVAPRRLDPADRPGLRGHLRPLGLDDQPRRRPHGHRRDLRRRPVGRLRPGRPRRRRRRLDAALRRHRRRARRRRDPRRHTRAVLAPPRPERGHSRGRRPAHPLGQGARGPGQEALPGRQPESVAARESLANPEAFDWFVQFASERAR